MRPVTGIGLRTHIVVAAIAGAGLAGAAQAGESFTDRAAFLAQLQPGYFSEDFESRADEGYASPLTLSGGAFAAEVSTTANGLLVFDLGGNDYLTTGITTAGWSAPVTLTFTTGNVTAVGGAFFVTSAFGQVVPENTVTLNFSDGSSFPITGQTNTSFFGYISDTPIASLTIVPDATHRFISIDNLAFGEAAVPTPAPALLLALGGAPLIRRRR